MVEYDGPLHLWLAVPHFPEGQVHLEGNRRDRFDALAPHQQQAAVQRLAPDVVHQPARQLGLP
jgi:hypothetical protein